MRKILAPFIFVLVFGVSLWSSAILVAGEHGGSDVKEHGGAAVESSAATMREAASILKADHPDLAAKLEKIAAEQE